MIDVFALAQRGGGVRHRLTGPRAIALANFLALAASAMLLALLSMTLTRQPGALAVLWLPNAFAVGWFWAFRTPGAGPLTAAVAAGIAAANYVYGDSLLVSGLLGAANGIEVFLACVLIARVLRFQAAHAGLSVYVLFLGAVCMLPALVAGSLGAAVVAMSYGAAWQTVFVGWVLSDFTSMLALAPFACLALRSTRLRTEPVSGGSWVLLGCLVCLVLAVPVFARIAPDISPVIIAGPVLSIFALWMSAGAVIVMTAGLLVTVSLIAFSIPAHFGTAFGLVDTPSAFVLIFGCLVIPGNLIVVAAATARAAERQAEELSRLKSEFLATMSHEIRTPLNAILGMFQLLQLAGLPEKQRQQAAVGQEAGERLLKLLSDVLEMSRLEAKAVTLSRRETRLDGMAAAWRGMAEATILRHGKTLGLTIDLDPGLPASLWVDEDRLSQIVHNLIDNAVRFTDSGRVTIGVSRAGIDRCGEPKTIEFWVADTGCGIPAERLSRIFERFSQVDGSMKRKVGGTGLGLAISSDLARLMGGVLAVDSVAGKGTTLRLRIPLSAVQKKE